MSTVVKNKEKLCENLKSISSLNLINWQKLWPKFEGAFELLVVAIPSRTNTFSIGINEGKR